MLYCVAVLFWGDEVVEGNSARPTVPLHFLGYPAATTGACTSARGERAGSGLTTSRPARSRHFRAQLNKTVQHRALRGPAVQGAHHASSTPASSSQLASSARHRRLPPHRLFRPYHRWSPSAAPAAREASAPHKSQKPSSCGRCDVPQHARGCKRLTDALTKLLMPGTIMRDTSACVISNRTLV